MKLSSTNLLVWVLRAALFGLVFSFSNINLRAEIWVGMKKGELFKELGAPISSLTAGPKELHQFSDGRRVEILNDQVVGFSGFPEGTIIEVKQSINEEGSKASTAYSTAAAKAKRASEFIDFNNLDNAPEESFTLSASSNDSKAENKPQGFLESNEAATLYILGGGIAACAIIGIAISFSRSRKTVALAAEPATDFNREIPPFLQSTPLERPSLLDPRGDMSELREERLSMREDPNSLGLSIRATPYQDFDSTELRGPLVSQVKESGANPAYSNAGNLATASSKPTRKKQETSPKMSEPRAK